MKYKSMRKEPLPVAKNLSANAVDTGWIPGFHIRRGNLSTETTEPAV